MLAQDEAFRILEGALATASYGAAGAEVALTGGQVGTTTFDEQGVVLSSEQRVERLSIRVAHHGGVSRVMTTDLSPDGVAAASEEARSRVSVLDEDRDVQDVLPDPQSYETATSYDPETAGMGALERAGWSAKAVMTARGRHLGVKGRVSVVQGAFEPDGSTLVYAVANTRGLLAYHASTRVTVELQMRQPAGGVGFAEDSSWAVSEVDMAGLVDSAVRDCEGSGDRRTLPTGTYRAVLGPSAMGKLLRYMGLTCGARVAEAGASFLSDRLKQKVVDSEIDIVDDFSHPRHRGLPFDVEGVSRKRVPIIREGVATAAVYAWASARRHESGVATGHRQLSDEFGGYEGASYLVMSGTTDGIDDLYEQVGDGVVVADIEAVRLVDSQALRLTGLVRGGLRLLRGGRLVGWTRPMRFELSLIDILSDVLGLGRARWASGSVVPPVATGCLPLYTIGES